MKKCILTMLTGLILSAALPITAFAQELIVGGQAVGIRVRTEGVLVSATAEVETAEGPRSPAADAGLREGDRILRVDGVQIHGAAELIAAVGAAGGAPVELTFSRDGALLRLPVEPALSAEGQWMLGMRLRDAVTGKTTHPTATAEKDPETGVYGALGHSLTDEELGIPVPLESGSITQAEICGVVPGSAGSPGALNGSFSGGKVLGTVESSGDCGIFGTAERSLGSFTAEVGSFRVGPASILATVDGTRVQEFSVRITRIYRDAAGEHVMLSVTDPELCALTGGIVQGMSGSPILQDGKLVGAVTHVFVNDPTRGYGLSIRDMLEAAGLEEQAA